MSKRSPKEPWLIEGYEAVVLLVDGPVAGCLDDRQFSILPGATPGHPGLQRRFEGLDNGLASFIELKVAA